MDETWVVGHGPEDDRKTEVVRLRRSAPGVYAVTHDSERALEVDHFAARTRRAAVLRWAWRRGLVRPSVSGPVRPAATEGA